MDKGYPFDQAEGLRRMLAGTRPRMLSFLSTESRQAKNGVLLNLAASLAASGNSAILLDACAGACGVATALEAGTAVTLLHVARGEHDLASAVYPVMEGFDMAVLARGSIASVRRNVEHAARLQSAFRALADKADVLLIDAELDEDDRFPLEAMSSGEIVVQVSDSTESIKTAYALIKRLNAQLGRRPFSVLVTGTSEQRAQVVFANISRVANRFLAVPLRSLGFVPKDEHVAQAARMGRPVIDAFPLAGASVAFRRLAGYFSYSGIPQADYGMMSH